MSGGSHSCYGNHTTGMKNPWYACYNGQDILDVLLCTLYRVKVYGIHLSFQSPF